MEIQIKNKEKILIVAKDWHRLPGEAVGSPSLEMSEVQLAGP